MFSHTSIVTMDKFLGSGSTSAQHGVPLTVLFAAVPLAAWSLSIHTNVYLPGKCSLKQGRLWAGELSKLSINL